MLFGSHARGDDSFISDIDLLTLIDTGTSHLHTYKMINSSVYTLDDFKKKVETSDPFIWHLKTEGKILNDESAILQNLLDTFKLKESYQKEKQDVLEKCWGIYNFAIRKDISIEQYVKSMTGCVRKLAILIMAEKKIPVFSYNDTIPHFKNTELSYLWSLKYKKPDKIIVEDLEKYKNFLLRYSAMPNYIQTTEKSFYGQYNYMDLEVLTYTDNNKINFKKFDAVIHTDYSRPPINLDPTPVYVNPIYEIGAPDPVSYITRPTITPSERISRMFDDGY